MVAASLLCSVAGIFLVARGDGGFVSAPLCLFAAVISSKAGKSKWASASLWAAVMVLVIVLLDPFSHSTSP
jgi:hypothetical protein